jgi:GWxTD domain-containing protein
MRIKIIIFVIVQFFIIFSCAAAVTDSILSVRLTDSLRWNESGKASLRQMELSFFDVDQQQLYVEFEIFRAISYQHKSPFVYLEIKKRSAQQFRLRPLVAKKIMLDTSSVYIDSLPLHDSVLASGNFDLILSYMGDSFKVIDVKKVPFQLLRNTKREIKDEFHQVEAETVSGEVDIKNTFVEKYTLQQLQRNISSLEPLSNGPESKAIKDLSNAVDLLTMKQFFYNFWYNRNPSDPEKAWKDYADILNELSKKYGSTGTPGYASDRGRIYIQYGPPDRLERVLNEKNALPYEVWFYYRSSVKPNKTNVKFLFFQPGLISSQMLLLHSNLPEEVINPYWKQMLLEDPNNNDNKLVHKVFEFFN